MKKKVVSMLMVGILAMGTLAGCGSSSTDSSSSDTSSSDTSSTDATDGDSDGDSSSATVSGEGHTISVILKTLNSDYWSACEAGIKAAEKDFGCTVNLMGPPGETSYDEQMNEIETTLASGSSEAIVIAPLQPEVTANLVADATIPVLAVDTTFESDKLVSYIGVSNKDAAKTLGEYAAKELGEGAKVALLAGTQGDTTSSDRMEGYTEAMEENGCTVLETQYTDSATDKAVSSMEGLLQKYPEGELDAVFTHSDDIAMGAAEACKQAGRDDVAVYGFGGISGADAVKDGTIKATVNINPYQMGYDCVEKALEAIEGKELDSFYPTEPVVVDQSNVDDLLAEMEEWSK